MKGVTFSARMAANLTVVEDQRQSMGKKADTQTRRVRSTATSTSGARKKKGESIRLHFQI
jgi:hypothetical protein